MRRRRFEACTDTGQGLSVRIRRADAGAQHAAGEALSRPDLPGEGWVSLPCAAPPGNLRRRIAVFRAPVMAERHGARNG